MRREPPATRPPPPPTVLIHEDTACTRSELAEGDADEALTARLGRYAVAHRRTLLAAEYVATRPRDELPALADPHELSLRLASCGTYLDFRRYPDLGRTRLHAARFCQLDKLCPLCAIRRAARSMRLQASRILHVLAGRPELRCHLVTHTVANGPDLAERLGHLRAALGSSTRRRRQAATRKGRSAWLDAAGGVYAIELKRGRGSGLWHPHAHAVWLLPQGVDVDELQRRVRQEWQQLTGDSHVVDVRPCHHVHDLAADELPTAQAVAVDLVEVFKYALKFSSMELPDTLRAARLVHGRRLVSGFGLLKAVPEAPDLFDEPVPDELAFEELLFRFAGSWLGGEYQLANHDS